MLTTNIYLSGSRWSPWSDWTSCSLDCIQTRRRTCIHLDTSMDDEIDRSSCVGKDFQTSECRGGSCHIDKGTYIFFFIINENF